jgi:DNA-binding NarL/FixJ family response regulator
VVDDDALQLELIGRALSRDGFEVTCRASPSTISEDVRRLAPDFVLLDVNMPGGPGGLALELGRKAAPPGVRFLLFSASDESTLRALAAKLNADGYMSKSWPVTDIGRRLRNMPPRSTR